MERYGWLHEELKRVLGKNDGKPDPILPWWRYIRSDFKNWESLVPRLHQERKVLTLVNSRAILSTSL